MQIFVGATIISLIGGTVTAQSTTDYVELNQLISSVDARMGGGTMQLSTLRPADDDFDIPLDVGQTASFGQRIVREVERHLRADQVHFTDYFDKEYEIEPDDDPSAVSLVSHPFCEESRETLGATLRKTSGLTDTEIEQVNTFVGHANHAREALIADPTDTLPAIRAWTTLGACLAYTESLGDPDTPISYNRAQQLLGDAFDKPEGVKFFYDPGHRLEESRWNIGLFQFVLFRNGNIQPCLVSWYSQGLPGGNVRRDLDLEQMGRFVGSPGQSFNSFCGINKIVQTLTVHALTMDPSRTHPSNMVNGRLKASSERCVSLHNKRSYSHFGPLIRTSTTTRGYDSNLDKVMSCAAEILGE